LRKLATLGLEKVENSDDLFERDFDNLIIIDACRHDLFEEVEGKTDYRITKESTSRGFIRENFSKGDFTEFVVVAANPFFEEKIFKQVTNRRLDDVFHTVFKTFETKWDEEAKTIRPESVMEDVRTAEKLFPDKKKIVWFMQPHYPFLSSELEKENTGMTQSIGKTHTHIWKEGEKGNFSQKELWKGYKDNLENVLPYVKNTSDLLNGKTILTSDHGNLAGENELYGHPGGMSIEKLRKVPILEL
jgi:hypothetical protein